jgi:KaiC/GvpD/RAD55 family RecA-like ATPase
VTQPPQPALQRVPSLVPGLDTILQGGFLGALSNALRSRGVTTVYPSEALELNAAGALAPPSGLPGIAENLLLLRYAERRGRLQRMLSILKIRDSGVEDNVRAFELTDTGIRLHPEASAGASLSRFSVETKFPDRGS